MYTHDTWLQFFTCYKTTKLFFRLVLFLKKLSIDVYLNIYKILCEIFQAYNTEQFIYLLLYFRWTLFS
jgi:hypothetical protein